MRRRPAGSPGIALLTARFNSLVTEQLLASARDHLLAAGVPENRISVHYVPGSWELPQAAKRLVDTGAYDAVIAIGCVIRGDTAHFDYVAGCANEGLGQVALASETPVIFGVLTTENADQALERADPAGANRGAEFAQAALDMMAFFSST